MQNKESQFNIIHIRYNYRIEHEKKINIQKFKWRTFEIQKNNGIKIEIEML